MSVPRRVPAAPTGVTPTSEPLSPARQRLVDLLRRVHFGRVHALVVRGGEPVFDPPPTVVRTLKLGTDDARVNAPQPPATRLKPAVAELLAHLTRLGDGVMHKIQVADGMPLLAEVEEHPRT